MSFASFESLESRTLLTALLTGFVDRTIVTGLTAPTAEIVAPDGRLFVCEKGGTLRVVQNGRLLTTPFLSVPVDTYSERGLDGVVLDPGFASNGFVYVYYTVPDPTHPGTQNDPAIHNRLSRFTVSASNENVADPSSELVLLDDIPSTDGNHNGGSMQFGADGMLYLGVGEAGVSSNAQDLSNLNGKILRLNVENPGNVIPADNPFVGTANARPEIWAYGFRNPFTSAVQPGTGKIVVNDVGSHASAAREEIDPLVKGANYGWPNVEGVVGKRGYTDPVYAYRHNAHGSGAIAGGVFYTGRTLGRKFDGKYLFSDYVLGFIDELDPNTGAESPFATGVDTPVDLDEAPDGGVYYLAASGSVHEILQGDGTPPTASLPVAPRITRGGGRYATFTVNYTDDTAVSAASIGSRNVLVTGPNGFSAYASLSSIAATTDEKSLFATYVFRAPGGTWNAPDDGAYTLTLASRQVRDAAGNPARGSVLGTLSVRV